VLEESFVEILLSYYQKNRDGALYYKLLYFAQCASNPYIKDYKDL